MNLKMYDYYNLRFGYCGLDSKSDFIDNINWKLNIHISKVYDNEENHHLLFFYNNKFESLKGGKIHDKLDQLASSFLEIDINFNKVAKGLILSLFERNEMGINNFCLDNNATFFEARESDEVFDYSPCFFGVGSISHKCDSEIDLNTGEILHNGEKIKNMSNFYGYIDEDETWVIGLYK